MKIFKITLDMIKSSSGYHLELVEDDYGSAQLQIELTINDQPYDLTGVTAIEIPFKTPQGTIYVHDLDNGVTVTDAEAGKITCLISTQALGQPGRVFFDVRIFKGLTLATSSQMRLYVRRPVLHDSAITDMGEYPLLQTLIIQCQAITDEEAVRVDQEADRVQAETQRITAEGLRAGAETARKTAEGLRDDAETARSNAEGLRVTAETARMTAEGLRAGAETARKTAEGLRDDAETARSNAEGLRVTAETARMTAEGLRAQAETARGNAEVLREQGETKRSSDYALAETARDDAYATAESDRAGQYATAEQGRDADYATAEEARDDLYASAELARDNSYTDAETARMTAEGLRAGAETARKTAEGLRDDAETARSNAEGLRVTAETARMTAEGLRAQAETARGNAEVLREQGETKRSSDYALAETARDDAYATAESDRAGQYATAEQGRDADYATAEEARDDLYASAELARDNSYTDAETARMTAEGLRAGAETARKTAEGLRDDAETARSNAEGLRVTAETARMTAEGLRAGAETARKTAEGLRDDAETARSNAEGLRVTAETARMTAEGLRAQAETARGNAEVLREQGETKRSSDYALAETARDDAYATAESDRAGQYATAEQGRDADYATAEEARDDLYASAELARDNSYTDAETARNDLTIWIKRRLDAIDPLAVFGVSWDKSSDPTLTRTDASIGLIANAGVDDGAVQNDFDTVQIFGEIHDMEDVLGNSFVRIPKLYIKKTDTSAQKTWQVSKTKHKGFYLPWCFWDFEKGKELPYIDIGKYKASLGDGNVLMSKTGTAPLVSRSIVQFREYAQNNSVGELRGYQQLDIHAYDLIQTLFYIEFATLNSQSIMQGYTSGRYGAEADLAVISELATNRIVVPNASAAQYRVGQTISVGTARYGTQVFYGRTVTAIEEYDTDNTAIVFDGDPVDIAVGNFLQNTGAISGFSSKITASSGSIGSNSDGKYPCMYRGIESPYGDIWQFVDGVNINEYQAWVALNASDYASNVFASPYKELGYVNCVDNGYPKEMGFDPLNPFAEFPVSVGGSSSTYYSGYYYQAVGQRIALVGGSWPFGSNAGLSCWSLYYSSSRALVNIGGRLLKKPL